MSDGYVSRRAFLRIMALATGAMVFSPLKSYAVNRSKKLNFLFILADDQRTDTIAAYGNKYIHTPNLDSLVKRGFSFRQNYCMGSPHGAVCVPSRAMIMTGRAYFKIDLKLKNVKTLPEILRENGYKTFATGKWHNGEESFLRSFEEGKAVFFGGMADHTKVPVVDTTPDGKVIHKRTAKKFSSECFADAVIEFLKNYKEDKPFFAYVAFTAPHDPRNAPLKYREMYYKNRPPLPKNFLPQHPFNNGYMVVRDENLAPWPRTEEIIRDQLAEYYGLITHLDEQIGRILKTLEESKLADNTIIIYAADQGLAMGSHGLLGKQNLYEHSMGCPLIFAGPGIPENKSSNALTYLLDIFPTICSLAGIQPPADIDGKNLRPIWEGKKTKIRDSIFLSLKNVQRAVRNERWKLIRYPQINYTQLFDLNNDLYELNNLAEKDKYSKQVEELMNLLKDWQKKVGDTQPLSTPNPKPMEIDLTGHERKPDKWQPEWIRKKYFSE